MSVIFVYTAIVTYSVCNMGKYHEISVEAKRKACDALDYEEASRKESAKVLGIPYSTMCAIYRNTALLEAATINSVVVIRSAL